MPANGRRDLIRRLKVNEAIDCEDYITGMTSCTTFGRRSLGHNLGRGVCNEMKSSLLDVSVCLFIHLQVTSSFFRKYFKTRPRPASSLCQRPTHYARPTCVSDASDTREKPLGNPCDGWMTYGTLEEWYWRGKTEVLEAKHFPAPTRPPQIPHSTGLRPNPGLRREGPTGDCPSQPWSGRRRLDWQAESNVKSPSWKWEQHVPRNKFGSSHQSYGASFQNAAIVIGMTGTKDSMSRSVLVQSQASLTAICRLTKDLSAT